MVRKRMLLCLVVFLVLALAACGQSGSTGSPSSQTAPKAPTAAAGSKTGPAKLEAKSTASAPAAAKPASTSGLSVSTKPMPAPGPSAGPAGKVLSTLKLADVPYRLAMSPNGAWIVTRGYNAGINIIKNNNGKLELALAYNKLERMQSDYLNTDIANDGTVVTAQGRTLYVLRPDKSDPVYTFQYKSDDPTKDSDRASGIGAPYISADGQRIFFVVGFKNSIASYGFGPSSATPLWQTPLEKGWNAGVISPDGKWAVLGSGPETLLFDMSNGSISKRLKLPMQKAPRFSPDSGFYGADDPMTYAVVAVGSDKPTIVHKVKEESGKINLGNVSSAGLSWGAQYAAVTRGRSTGLEYYRLDTEQPVWQIRGLQNAAIGIDGKVVASDEKGKLVAFNPEGKELWSVDPSGTSETLRVACSSDFRYVVRSQGTALDLVSGY